MGSNSLQIPIALPNHTPTLSTPLSFSLPLLSPSPLLRRRFQTRRLAIRPRRASTLSASSAAGVANSVPRNGHYTVGDFMTTKESLHVVKPSTTVDQGKTSSSTFPLRLEPLLSFSNWFASIFFTALDFLVEKRITGFPVVDDDWKLVNILLNFLWLCMRLNSVLGFRKEWLFCIY